MHAGQAQSITTHTLSVLVVEDEGMIAMMVEEWLDELGCTTVGPAPSVAQGIRLASTRDLDCALLDVNVAGERVFPVADILRQRGIPFAFLTGYGRQILRAEDDKVPVLTKPFRQNDVAALLNRWRDGRE